MNDKLNAILEKIQSASLKWKIALGVVIFVFLAAGLSLAPPAVRRSIRRAHFPMSPLAAMKRGIAMDFAKVQSARTNLPVLAEAVYSKGNVAEVQSRVEDWNSASVPFNQEERKVVRQGWMEIEVKKFKDANISLFDAARSYDAEIFSSDSQNPEGEGAWGTVVFLVDPGKLAPLMEELGRIGTVKTERIQSRDVTESYVDLKAQLANSEHVRDRLTQIMNSQAGRLKDVLEVERELARVCGTIESLKGQIRYLDHQSDRSRLEVRLFEKSGRIVPDEGILYQIRQIISQTWDVFFGTVAGLFILLGYALGLGVYVAVIAAAVLLFKRLFKKPGPSRAN